MRTAIVQSSRDPGLHHALGLVLTRLKRPTEALDELRRAAELAPDHARYAYVYAVALHSNGHRQQAMAALETILISHPDDRAALQALTAFARDAGDATTALAYANRLAQLAPDDANIKGLVESLRHRVEGGAPQPARTSPTAE